MLREPTFLILAALAPRSLHGYGILRSVEDLSSGRVRLRAGTRYAALDRMVSEGLIVRDGDEVVDGRVRHNYRITSAGQEVLAREVEHLEANASVAKRQLARILDPGLA
ncbi:MAG TPA: PadR family transcriptional regulator [Acidimicrobiia bacterium]